MTLRDCQKLQVGDTFRRPSTNQHDEGWKLLRVTGVETDNLNVMRAKLAFTAVDQHGYEIRVRYALWRAVWKDVMHKAERCS